MKPVTNERLPVEASMSGKNTYYIHCPSLNRRTNYGVCLFTLRAHQRNQLNPESDCYRAINCHECEARRYQELEVSAGRALYYVPRDSVIPTKTVSEPVKKKDSDAFRRGQEMVAERYRDDTSPLRAALKRKADESDFTQHLSGSLSDAVSSAVKRDSETIDEYQQQKDKTRAALAKTQTIAERGDYDAV